MSALGRLTWGLGANPPLDGLTPVFEEMGADPRIAPGADRPPGSIAKVGTLYLSKCDTAATCWEPITCDVVNGIGVSTGGNTAGQTGTFDGSAVLAAVSGITLSQATDASGGTISIIGHGLGVSTQGNTAGQTGLLFGDAVLVGVSGVSLSQATGTGGKGTISIIGQTGTATSSPLVIRAGTQDALSGTVVFSNSNGLTFGMSASSIVTASYSQSTAPAGLGASGSTITNGTVVFSASNGIAFGISGSTVTASYTQSTSPHALSAGTELASSGTIVLADSHGVSFGMSAGTITASVAAGATATGNLGALAAGSQTATSGTVAFANSNGLTFGMSGSSQVTASYSTAVFSNSNGITFGTAGSTVTAAYSQSTAPAGLAVPGTTLTNGTVVFSNSNGVTFGIAGSTVTASYSQQTLSTAPGAIAAGTQTATSGTIVFSNSNGVSFGLSGSTRVTASHNAVSELGVQDSAGVGVNQGVPRLIFATSAGANVTFGKSVNGATMSITANVAALGGIAAGTQTATSGNVVFANSNSITFGMSGSSQVTASIGAGAGAVTVSHFENFAAADLNATTLGDIQLFLQRLHVPAALSATRANFIIQVSNSNNAGGSITLRFGVYTMSGSTASLASSASRTWGYNSTAAASSYTAQSGYRYRSVTLGTWNLTPGDYLFGAVVSISTSGTSGSYSWKARRNLPLDVAEFGTASTTNFFWGGTYTSITGNLRNSLGLGEIAVAGGGGAADENDFPWFNLIGSF